MADEIKSITVEPIYPDLTFPPNTAFREIAVEDPESTHPEVGENGVVTLPGIAIPTGDDYADRQKIFDPKLHTDDIKKSNGQPYNFKIDDAYPIDKKIAELEFHNPTIPSDSTVILAEGAEKRICQLENVVATMSRMIFRMAARVNINCVYYGGQDSFQKYNCIRCLNDDLINDCQSVSMDQCLNCTRYEPIIGQVYDILNGSDQNLSIVLDDIQGSYETMDEYIKLTRVEEMHNEASSADLNKNPVDKPKTIKDSWKSDFNMDWTPTPIMDQISDIEAYKTINSYEYIKGTGPLYDGRVSVNEAKQTLESLSVSSGGPDTSIPFTSSHDFDLDFHGLKSSTDPFVQNIITNISNWGKSQSNATYQAMITNLYAQDIGTISSKAGLDPLMILAIIATETNGNPNEKDGLMQVEGTGITDAATAIQNGVNAYKRKIQLISGVTAPLFVLNAYNAGNGYITGLDAPGTKYPTWISIKAADPNQIRCADFLPSWRASLIKHSNYKDIDSNRCTYYAKVIFCYNYLYDIISKSVDANLKSIFIPPVPSVEAGATEYDGKYRFPFDAEYTKGNKISSPYGWRDFDGGKFHPGTDFTSYTPAGADHVIMAVESGTVLYSGDKGDGYGNHVVLRHSDGNMSLYAHMKDNSLKVGINNKVVRGQPLGVLGSTGHSTGPHLHFGIYNSKASSIYDINNSVNPEVYFNLKNISRE